MNSHIISMALLLFVLVIVSTCKADTCVIRGVYCSCTINGNGAIVKGSDCPP
ncbi:hypothetical protein PGT21_019179 [Puccinia graminis f. sp. tritici]|uniref:Extracellular membrane protein CFEM domain-containing protein n=1 Tax=Puccinia graminis f. sp. tritici TaxID=56615 RepID=A0A5B0LLJ4_PUCGR|nr:hypothetical protein PGT21_019179 [Puccinia graminis f. sp. tritici]